MTLSDDKLLKLCDKFGKRALLWRRKFIGLLPEVNRRRLFERRNCSSIFEFAAKLGGLSEGQVRRALNLSYDFRDKPGLRALLTNGSVGLSKLARVASIATPENEMELAEKVKLLPQKTLETLVRDERFSKNINGLIKPLFEEKSVRAHTTFDLSSAVVEKLEKLEAQGQDVNAILLELLEKREAEIANKKEQIVSKIQPSKTRHISAKIKNLLKEEFGEKCSIQHCKKPSTEVHHTQRFSLAHTHDPRYLAPLCKEHHQLAHSIDLASTRIRKAAFG